MSLPLLKPGEADAHSDLHGENARRVAVLLPLPLAGAYDYLLPEGAVAARGTFVRAPLGKREVLGVVWGEGTGEVAPEKLRELVIDSNLPPMPPHLCDFVDWLAKYTLTPPGAVLALAMRPAAAFDPESMRRMLVMAGAPPGKATAARTRVLALMKDELARTPSEIAKEAGVTASVATGLAKTGALKWIGLPEFEPFAKPDPAYGRVELRADQAQAAREMVGAVNARAFSTTLLDGVTGSGKTEAYFEAVAAALNRGRQALILLPEIALTVQFLDRFAARFGCRPAEWHSDLPMRERKRAYRAVRAGDARVVVGARSALFLPFPELGVIVVDEEHDHAYKQEEGVIYHARDMAVVRARIENCPVVLSSATPSLETFVNAQSGRYSWLKLARRHGAAQLPEVRLVDMRENEHRGAAGQFLSWPLRGAIEDALAQGEQALLFLNRRGYAPLTLCASCGHKATCRNCSAWLVEHRYRRRLICHHCGYEQAPVVKCPLCAAENSFIACGPGVERVEEELRAAFPDARVAVASSDTLAGPNETQAAIRAMSEGLIDVLIGTQVVAKGHHFPQLTLVGVVDADLGGQAGDPRAAERSFQLLHQVAGRSGRGDKPGLVLIQTRNPTDPVMRALASHARDDFYAGEIRARESAMSPPFGRLAALILSGNDGDRVRAAARDLALAAPKTPGLTVWGPAPAYYQILRGRTRERLLVQADKSIDVQAFLRAWLALVKIPPSVQLALDVDPLSFF